MGAKRKRFSMPQGKAYTIEQCHHFNISPATRELWIAGREFTDGPSETSDIIEPGVEYGMVTNVLKNLALLRQMSKTEPVTIHLHTKGGEWFQGMAIYDAIISMPYRVTIIGYAEVRSMSSIIFQAGDRRLIMPNATFMIHEGEVYYSGTPKQARSAFYFDQRTSEKKMVDIYVQKALGSPRFKGNNAAQIEKQIRAQMEKKEDVWLTAEEAVEWGFADAIFTNWNEVDG